MSTKFRTEKLNYYNVYVYVLAPFFTVSEELSKKYNLGDNSRPTILYNTLLFNFLLFSFLYNKILAFPIKLKLD